MRRALLAFALAAAACGAAATELKPWTGGAAPELALADLSGRQHRLADYRGRVVLVNFWATWCEPCRAEMPSIDRLRKSLDGRPFQVLAVNLAEPLSRIERFAEAVPVGFPLLRDRDGSAGKAWRARLLPASYLIGRGGRIRYVAYGELDWTGAAVRARVEELLREGPARPERAEKPAELRKAAPGARPPARTASAAGAAPS
jgi:thiol-disulfide isomerase/thioredoxin